MFIINKRYFISNSNSMKNQLSFLIVLFSVLMIGCHKKKITTNVYTEEMAKIVSQVSNGKIGCEDKIEVKFVNSIVTKDQLNQTLKEEVFQFTSALKGKTYWKDTRTLIFEPEKPLPFRKVYDGELDLRKLSEEFKKNKTTKLKFSIEVSGRELASCDAELILKDRNDPRILLYRGKITLTEKTTLDELKQAVNLKYNSGKIELVWDAQTDGRVFSFVSQDITRDDKTKDYTLSISKSKLDLSDDFKKEFQVTPIEEMKIIEISKIEEGRQPKIRIEFSDEFDPEQNLNGLITVSPKTEMKIQKLGNAVILDGGFKFGNEYTVNAESGIRSRWGTKTKERFTSKIQFSDVKPQVEFLSDGVILPSGNKYKLQFYTANLKRVHIEVKKVFESSLYEFINTEQVSSNKDRKTAFNNSYVNRVGVIVHNETFEIGNTKNTWLLNEIDLTDIVKKHDKALLLIQLNFNPRDMLVDISGAEDDYIGENAQVYKPLFFSDIGLTCKVTGSEMIVFATDVTTCKPLNDVKIELRSLYDDNVYESATTDGDGKAVLTRRYYGNAYIQAEKDEDRSIIKFNEMQWNISGFDVSGVNEFEQNTKAFIYTERGVYRPGDDMNISVIVRYNEEDIPDNHPVTLELFNPQGKKVYTVTSKQNKQGFFNFPVRTKEGDPTGNWRATFNIGNKEFEKEIKIETVVPYRLKVNIDTPSDKMNWSATKLAFDIRSTYLFGTPAANLPASAELEITGTNKSFPNFENFVFSNPSLDFKDIQKSIFEGSLDETGIKHMDWNLPDFDNVPSSLNFKITAKVLEKGGRPNINWVNVTYNPYSNYVGLQAPRYNYLATGNDADIPLIVVNNDGKPVAGKSIKYRIYRNNSYWWWHYDKDRNLRFKTDNSTVLVKEGSVISRETQSYIKFLPVEQGRYLVEAIDETGTKHSAGIFIDAYPYGGNGGGDKNEGTLALYANKPKYFVGEEAKIQFPSPKTGLILVTIEKEDKILQQKWYYPEKDGEFALTVPITKEMVPNAYVSVSLLQPHSQTKNDRPIRMFGILPLNVEDKDTKFDFDILTSAQFKPKEPFEVTVQTKDKSQAQFTIAVVDEGLLALTQFHTPDPWKYFFRKTRLKVETYDLFSEIIAANKDDVFKTFSIGGDADYRESQLQPEKGRRRFMPVCLFKGPAMTGADGKATVKFLMPEYVGAVRVMVVGARENSFANAEKNIPVKSDLMVMGSLPRVIGPDEKFTIPVNVFALKENIGNVNVEIKTEGPLTVEGNKTATLNFTKATDKDVFFAVQTKPETGQSKVTIAAKSAVYTSTYTVDLMVRPSAPRNYSSKDEVVLAGQKTILAVPGQGIKGTNNATLSISSFPVMNFSHRLNWLIHYPYGCIEQTTSSVFPQLYLKKFIQYPEANAQSIDENINAGIQRLRKFQLFSGGFSYWPYGDHESEWGTLYGGHFLVEAKKLGYFVEEDLYDNWLNYTAGQARNNSGDLMNRVYRVYILALAGKAELSEMNQLRESKLKELDNVQKWLLAAAYQLDGLPDKVNDIIKNAGTDTKDYAAFTETFGSGLRDKAMILDALVILKKFDKADALTRDIAKYISATTWYSTQTIGYSLVSMGKYMAELTKNQKKSMIKGTIVYPDGTKVPFSTDKTVSFAVKKGFGQNIEVLLANESTVKKAYLNLAWNGVPLKQVAVDESKNLTLTVKWYDDKGSIMDPTELKQGTTFWGHFHVKNVSAIPSVKEIALVQILPSGWEIENVRLLGESLPPWAASLVVNKEDYLDIRDDRVMWFFDLYEDHSTLHNEMDFVIKLNTVTLGEFDLPPTLAEAMYNDNFKAVKAGNKVKVVK
jgi:alpha-2-macroglobulin